jgi:hypothetical protein
LEIFIFIYKMKKTCRTVAKLFKKTKVVPIYNTPVNTFTNEPQTPIDRLFDKMLNGKIQYTDDNNNTITVHPNSLRTDWKTIETNHHFKGLDAKNVWKQLIVQLEDDPQKKLLEFRKKLRVFLQNYACVQTDTDVQFQKCDNNICIISGKEAPTSDIDVTVKGDCWDLNLYRLMAIRELLKEIFDSDTIFKRNLELVFKFFDLNLYLSNFAILKKDTNNPKLADYIISHDFEKQFNFIKNEQRNTFNTGDDYIENYYKIVEDTNKLLCKYENSGHNQEKENEIINYISEIAKYEDECYVTQGAFMHVVYMMQQRKPLHEIGDGDEFKNTKIIFNEFMINSILENLHFASTHAGESRGKYLFRVLDADYKRNLLTFPNVHTQNINFFVNTVEVITRALRPIWRKVEEYISFDSFVKLHTYRYNKNVEKGTINDMESKFNKLLSDISEDTINSIFDSIQNHASKRLPRLTFPFEGGRVAVKKLLDATNAPVKKSVNGRMCVVYIDAKRRQYVKQNGTNVRLTEAKKQKSTQSNGRKSKK